MTTTSTFSPGTRVRIHRFSEKSRRPSAWLANRLRDGLPVVGKIIDHDEDAYLVGVEILGSSRPHTMRIAFDDVVEIHGDATATALAGAALSETMKGGVTLLHLVHRLARREWKHLDEADISQVRIGDVTADGVTADAGPLGLAIFSWDEVQALRSTTRP